MDGKGQRMDAEMPGSTKIVTEQDELRQKLSDELRSLYNGVLDEPLPENMMNFLRDLDRGEDDQKHQDQQDNGDGDG